MWQESHYIKIMSLSIQKSIPGEIESLHVAKTEYQASAIVNNWDLYFQHSQANCNF
jgi:hypothetical protein